MGALTGIRILEMAQLLNGPAAGYMLGDLGAQVIKIEPPITGDLGRGFETMFDVNLTTSSGKNVGFEFANRNKKGIILNLKNSAGKAVFQRLIEKSDVFLTNYSKKVIHDLDIDYESLSKYNTKLIYAATTGFGGHGPLSQLRAYDMIGQALSGAMWIFGDRDSQEPSVAVGSIFDQIGATLLAYAVLAALVTRERTGVGQKVETSLLGAGIHIQALNIATFLLRGRGMARFSHKRCRNPLVNYYKCSDGKWLLLSEAQSQRYWHDICVALDIEEIEFDERFKTANARRNDYAEFTSILERVFETKPRDEWLKIFSQYKFVHSAIYDYKEMANEPQVWENKYLVEMDHPTMGKIKTVGCPIEFSKTPSTIQSAAPEFGQHTEEVLIEVGGYSWEEISELRKSGAFN